MDLIAIFQDADDFRVRLQAAAVALRAVDVLPAHAEAIDGGIRHEVRGDDVLRQARLQAERLVEVDVLRLDAADLAPLDPGLLIVRVVAVEADEHAARGLDAALADLAEDRVFFNTFLRSFLIFHCVAAAAVQQAVVTRARAVDEVLFLYEHDIHATHREVAQDADARRAAADDNDCCFFHRETPLS